jgi:flagellar protein FlbD
MIQLTRLNGSLMVVNSDLIKYAEASPDTMLTLINGEKIMVLETCDEVVERTVGYRARLLSEVARNWPSDWIAPAELASAASAMRAAAAPSKPSKPQPDESESDEEDAQRRRRPE